MTLTHRKFLVKKVSPSFTMVKQAILNTAVVDSGGAR